MMSLVLNNWPLVYTIYCQIYDQTKFHMVKGIVFCLISSRIISVKMGLFFQEITFITELPETPGDLVWDLPCVQQASCLEGGPLLWIWPLYLHVNQKSDDDDDDDELPGSNFCYPGF